MRPTVLCIWFFPQVFISLHTIETGAIRVNWVVKSYILPWNETLDYLVSIMILTRNRCAMYLVPTSKVLIAFSVSGCISNYHCFCTYESVM